MNRRLTASCIDINTPYCPCLLAETNHCVFCSHLRGQPVCDCNWGGVCILYEKQWQPKNAMAKNGGGPSRTDELGRIVRREPLGKDTYLLEVAVTEELARGLEKTGAFVFLRRPEDPQFFHFPVGVMKVEGRNLQMVVEAVGPKSNRVLEDQAAELLVRGPYYNGVLGQPWIDNITCGKILLISGGMGQAPALPIAAKLAANRNEVTAILAPGHVGSVFIEAELVGLGVKTHVVDSLRRTGFALVTGRLGDGAEKPDLIVSAGPDEQHYGVINAMQAAGLNLPMAATNNSTMCCGEGICGSCTRETQDNRIIRTCKVQTDFTQLL